MLRYPAFRIGRWWVTEYGDPAKEEDFKWLYAYSPYHHVKDGTRYPATLLSTGESDNRVDPMHARKMAARLEEAQGDSSRPILLRVDAGAGHGQGKPESKLAEQTRRRAQLRVRSARGSPMMRLVVFFACLAFTAGCSSSRETPPPSSSPKDGGPARRRSRAGRGAGVLRRRLLHSAPRGHRSGEPHLRRPLRRLLHGGAGLEPNVQRRPFVLRGDAADRSVRDARAPSSPTRSTPRSIRIMPRRASSPRSTTERWTAT